MKLKKGHQGDVQFRQITSMPKGAKETINKPIALGEHSGHQHVLTGDVKMYELEDTVFAVVGKSRGRLQHIHESNFRCVEGIEELPKADHGSIILDPGIYEFWIQNQYNPYSKLMEKSQD